MKNILLVVSFLLLMVLLTACNQIDRSKLSDNDLERISEKAVVCNSPYIRYATECCLDQNDNKICDKDERELTKEEKEKEDKINIPSKKTTDKCPKDLLSKYPPLNQEILYKLKNCEKTSYRQSDCYVDVFKYEYYNGSQNIRVCNLVKKADPYFSCYLLFAGFQVEDATLNPCICELVDDRFSKKHKGGCYAYLSFQTEDENLCLRIENYEGIGTDDERADCLRSVAIQKKDPQICDLIEIVGPNSEYFKKSCYAGLAVDFNDATICPEKYLDQCYETIELVNKELEGR